MKTATPQRHNVLGMLESRGYRLTGPRRRVAEAVALSSGDGFTAEAMCDGLAGVGRATVFRTLKLLLEAGAICKLPMPDGAPRYQLSEREHHHHTVCVRCGTIGEFRDATAEKLVRAVGRDIPGRIVGHRMELLIVCPQCQVNDRRPIPAATRAQRAPATT